MVMLLHVRCSAVHSRRRHIHGDFRCSDAIRRLSRAAAAPAVPCHCSNGRPGRPGRAGPSPRRRPGPAAPAALCSAPVALGRYHAQQSCITSMYLD